MTNIIKIINPRDYVAISFWLISIALTAFTGFLVLERENVEETWKTSISVCAMITGIAAVHYYYMRSIWVNTGKNPITYRYIDWFITVPLQVIEFYLILSVANKIPIELFYRLLTASVGMILFGFLGESNVVDRISAFVVGMSFWLYIIYELFYGDASKLHDETTDEAIKFTFNWLRIIVTFGWSIYPIGYLLNNYNMNLVYNIGDFINKIVFCAIIWYAAKYL